MPPLIALTLGDVAGIGPEVIVRGWNTLSEQAAARLFVIGASTVLERACRQFGDSTRVRTVAEVGDVRARPGVIDCLEGSAIDVSNVAPGAVDSRAGRAAYDYLNGAIDLALARRIDAITTLPLNKAGLNAAGVREPGHTEILARRCGVERHAMMLYVAPPLARGPGGLGVVHATLHMSLREALASLNTDAVASTIFLAHEAMRPLVARGRPRIAVAGLNPHAGEGGLFGEEEASIIEPALARARDAGCDVTGPVAADTLFRGAFDGAFDAVVAMYHDQGHVAVKSVAFWEAVNVTLGLPIVRTSVAHGTAYDIAWTGQARPTSLIEAVRVAARLVQSPASGQP